MQEGRRRRTEQGDVSATEYGDFTDWDNPEDSEVAEAGDEEEEYYIPGPDDPDYDLSEEAGYSGWEPSKRDLFLPRWLLVAVSLLLIVAILLPAFRLLG